MEVEPVGVAAWTGQDDVPPELGVAPGDARPALPQACFHRWRYLPGRGGRWAAGPAGPWPSLDAGVCMAQSLECPWMLGAPP